MIILSRGTAKRGEGGREGEREIGRAPAARLKRQQVPELVCGSFQRSEQTPTATAAERDNVGGVVDQAEAGTN